MKTQSAVILDRDGISINGKKEILLCASLFYFRIPAELWRDRIRKLRMAGYNCADVYFPWNYHETKPGEWQFEGDRDVEAFLGMMAEEQIYVVARPGPYICSEWDGGSIPGRLLADGTEIRSDNPLWMSEVREWYSRIIPMLAGYQIHRGGSIILLQVENELDFFDCPDPKAYMGKLALMAREYGMDVPIFGCAGQGSAEGATGWADDVVPTFNFYPSAFDSSFDPVILTVHKALQERNLPFLITETGREHFLLRREMANGARLLGAYNQVAGTNFGFSASINNWGKGDSPLSFLATDYDFDSMIDAVGRFREEALEGRLLGGLLDALGEPLAMSAICDVHDIKVIWPECSKKNQGNGTLIDMGEAGKLLSIANFSDREQPVSISTPEGKFDASVGPFRAPFFPLSLNLRKAGTSGVLVYASAEVLKIADGELVLYADGVPVAVFESMNGERTRVAGFGVHAICLDQKTIQVSLLEREAAQRMDIGRGSMEALIPKSLDATQLHAASVRTAVPETEWMQPLKGNGGIHMEACGLSRGTVSYRVMSDSGTGLLLKGAADIVQGWRNGRYLGTRISGGQWQHYSSVGLSGGFISEIGGREGIFSEKCGRGDDIPENGSLEGNENQDTMIFRVDSWGHSNFDDARLPSMRIAAPKGICGLYQVNAVERESLMWRFRLHDQWLPETLPTEMDPMAAILPPNAWNSTRMPLIAFYSTRWTLREGSDACVLEMTGPEAETAVYVDGIPAGVMNAFDPWLELTSLFEPGQTRTISLLCRKRHWAEPAGTPALYHLTTLKPVMAGCSEQELAVHDFSAMMKGAGSHDTEKGSSDGILLIAGETRVFRYALNGLEPICRSLRIKGCDIKVTGLFNNHLLGRVFSPGNSQPDIVGGDSELLYLPGPWFIEAENLLILIIEALGIAAQLESVCLES